MTQGPSTIVEDAVNFVFDESGFYVRLANRAIEHMTWHQRIRYRGHRFCLCLNELSKAIDPATYAKFAQTPIRAGLLLLGFPKFLAEVLSAASAFGVKQFLGMLPPAHLSTSLRAIIPLICPNLDVCPARTEVVKTYASPVLTTELRALVASVR